MQKACSVWIRLLAVLSGMLLCFAILLVSTLQIGCNADFYRKQQKKLSVAQELGVTSDDLETLTRETISFLQGMREDYDIRLADGEQIFSKSEQSHMKDVQRLFALGRIVCAVLFAVAGTVCVCLMLRREDGLFLLARGYRIGCVTLTVLLGGVALYALTDWEAAFNFFHVLMQFPDGGWIFAVGTPLIVFLPGEFFMAAAVRIAVQTGICWAVFFAASLFVRSKRTEAAAK